MPTTTTTEKPVTSDDTAANPPSVIANMQKAKAVTSDSHNPQSNSSPANPMDIDKTPSSITKPPPPSPRAPPTPRLSYLARAWSTASPNLPPPPSSENLSALLTASTIPIPVLSRLLTTLTIPTTLPTPVPFTPSSLPPWPRTILLATVPPSALPPPRPPRDTFQTCADALSTLTLSPPRITAALTPLEAVLLGLQIPSRPTEASAKLYVRATVPDQYALQPGESTDLDYEAELLLSSAQRTAAAKRKLTAQPIRGQPPLRRRKTPDPKDLFATVNLASRSATPSLSRRRNITAAAFRPIPAPPPSAVAAALAGAGGIDDPAPDALDDDVAPLATGRTGTAQGVDHAMILSDNDDAPVEDVELPAEEEPRADGADAVMKGQTAGNGNAHPREGGAEDEVMDLIDYGAGAVVGSAKGVAETDEQSGVLRSKSGQSLELIAAKMRDIRQEAEAKAAMRREPLGIDETIAPPDTAYSRQMHQRKMNEKKREQLRAQKEKQKAKEAKMLEKKKKMQRRKRKALAKARGEVYVSESEQEGASEEEEEGSIAEVSAGAQRGQEVVDVDNGEENHAGGPYEYPHGNGQRHDSPLSTRQNGNPRMDGGQFQGHQLPHNGHGQNHGWSDDRGPPGNNSRDGYHHAPPPRDNYPPGPAPYPPHGPPPGPPPGQYHPGTGGPPPYPRHPNHAPPYHQYPPPPASYPPNPPPYHQYPPQHGSGYPSPYPPNYYGPPPPYGNAYPNPDRPRLHPGEFKRRRDELYSAIRNTARDLREEDARAIDDFLDNQRLMFAPNEREKYYLLERGGQHMTKLRLHRDSGCWDVVKTRY